jgi:hypothetical protein
MKLKLTVAFMILLASAIVSCKSKEDKNGVSTDLVTNPLSANGENGEEKLPIVTFETETHDFGHIEEGEKISFGYKFKNTGNADLVISDARGSCGCTVPEYPKEPIKPGEESVIKVTFDSSGKGGKQNKTVTLITNAIPNTKVLTLTGLVTARSEVGRM